MAKAVVEAVAVLAKTDAAETNGYAATALGERGTLIVYESERRCPGKHFALFSHGWNGLLRTSYGTLERDGAKVFVRNTTGGHTYEFELLEATED